MYTDFEALATALAPPSAPVRAVIAGCEDPVMLSAAVSAWSDGWLNPVLLGSRSAIQAFLESFPRSAGGIPVLESSCPARMAAQMCATGQADVLVQGSLPTRQVLDPFLCQSGALYGGTHFAHLFLAQLPRYHKLLALCIPAVSFPTQPKLDGLLAAVEAMLVLGWSHPTAAVLCPQDELDPKLADTFVASELDRMCINGEIRCATLYGSITYESAMNRAIAQEAFGLPSDPTKTAPQAAHQPAALSACGDFDLLVAPSPASGYILSGCWTASLGATVLHLAIGGPVPAVIRPRTGGRRSAELSLYLAALLAKRRCADASV